MKLTRTYNVLGIDQTTALVTVHEGTIMDPSVEVIDDYPEDLPPQQPRGNSNQMISLRKTTCVERERVYEDLISGPFTITAEHQRIMNDQQMRMQEENRRIAEKHATERAYSLGSEREYLMRKIEKWDPGTKKGSKKIAKARSRLQEIDQELREIRARGINVNIPSANQSIFRRAVNKVKGFGRKVSRWFSEHGDGLLEKLAFAASCVMLGLKIFEMISSGDSAPEPETT